MQPKVVETTLDSGIRVHVTPMSRYQRSALQAKSEDVYKYPDKSEYEITPEEGVAIAGFKVSAESNPEYQAEVTRIDALRAAYFTEHMLAMCVKFPDFDTREGLIAHFAGSIAEQREFMTLPEDDWQATWRFAILRSTADEAYIAQIARDELPLKEVEVSEAMRIFRPAVSRENARLLAYTRQLAPLLQTKIQNQS